MILVGISVGLGWTGTQMCLVVICDMSVVFKLSWVGLGCKCVLCWLASEWVGFGCVCEG